MKRIFFAFASFLTLSLSVQAQTNDTTSQWLNYPLINNYIPVICHAVPSLVWSKAKKETIKKYRPSEQYKISSDGQTWKDYSPLEGEEVLSYKGTYFYSVTYKSLIMKVGEARNSAFRSKKPKRILTPEEKMQRDYQRQQILGSVVQMGQQAIYRQQQRQGGW